MFTDDEKFYVSDYFVDYGYKYPAYPDYYYEANEHSRNNARWDERLKNLIFTTISEKKFKDLKNLIDSSNLSLKTRFYSLCYAVSCDHMGAAKLMLQSTPHLVDQVKNRSYCSTDDEEMVLSVHPNENFFRFHELFLILAVDRGNEKVVKLLLSEGADVHFKSEYKISPYSENPTSYTSILIAVRRGYVQIVEQLLIHGADVNSRYPQSDAWSCYESYTLLLMAVKDKSKPIIDLLLLYGADINATENHGLTPLHMAAFTREFSIIKYLVKEGAYINLAVTYIGGSGETVYHKKSRDKRNALADYVHLLSNMCYDETKLTTEKNDTSLHAIPRLTVETKCDEIIAYVLERYPDTHDVNNKTALFPAISSMGTQNDKSILLKLIQYDFQWGEYEDIYNLPELLPDEFQYSRHSKLDDLDHRGKNNSDLLFDAVRGNFFNTVKLLLENGAEVHKEYDGYNPYFRFCSSLLHVAVIMGDMDMVRLLMDYGANPDAKNINRGSPLLFAVALSESEIATLLLKNGAKVFDNELLILAVEKSNIEVIQILLEKDTNINNINEKVRFENEPFEILSYSRTYGLLPELNHGIFNSYEGQPMTALDVAANIGRYAVVKLLLNRGAKADGDGFYNETPLYFSARNGHFETVKLLLENGANITDGRAQKAFHEAAKAGHCEVVELLMKFGVENDSEDDKGNTPLLNSIEARRWEVVEVLLRSGANFQKCTRTQLSPLDIAIRNADDKAVKLLLEHGAKGSESRYFKSSIAIFTRKRKPAIVELLLKSGVNIKGSNWWGGSVLLTAAEMNSDELVKLLLDYGSDTYEVKDYVEPLLISAENGNLQIIERLLQLKACTESANKEGQTALFKAAEKGQTETVQALLKYGASVNSRTSDGETPLSISASKGHLDIVQILLRSNVDTDSTDNRGRSPIYNAARKGHIEIVRQLLMYGATVDIKNINNETPLFISASRGHLDIVETLLEFKVDVNSTDKNGKSPLHSAVENGHVEVVKILLKCGATTDKKTNDGETPLLISVGRGHLDIVEILLNFKAEINLADKNWKTPLYTAVKEGQLEIIKLLMKHGAATETRTADGKTPLSIAIEQNYLNTVSNTEEIADPILDLRAKGVSIQQSNTEIIQLLLEHGASVNYEDGRGNTPLIISMMGNNISLSQTLLKYGASTEQTNRAGETPLHVAAENYDTETVKLLLECGANVEAKRQTGETPLLLSVKRGELKMIEVLLEAGADINAVDYSERTSLYIAVHERLTNQVVQLLLDYGAEIDSKTLKEVRTGGLEGPTILCHIVKMKVANLYKGADFVDIGNNSGQLKIVEFQERCMVQVTKMMDQYIDDTTVTFYKILTKNLHQLTRFAMTRTADDILNSGDHRYKFPIYADNIEIQIQKGKIRKNLMEQGIKVYTFLISQYTDLPYELMVKILCHLSNNELRMLINSCKPILALPPTGTTAVLSPSLENLDLFDTSEDWISQRSNHK